MKKSEIASGLLVGIALVVLPINPFAAIVCFIGAWAIVAE